MLSIKSSSNEKKKSLEARVSAAYDLVKDISEIEESQADTIRRQDDVVFKAHSIKQGDDSI